MSYTYDVPKNKYTRLSYRFLGSIFLFTALAQLYLLMKGFSEHKYLTAMFLTALGLYGIYLIAHSFRKQAYNITYRFDENGMTVRHKYGETLYTFDEIAFITMVIADENGIFYVLNIKAKNDIYTIPFTMKKDYCEAIYEFVNSRIKHDDEENPEN